jgi:hypothetical protein
LVGALVSHQARPLQKRPFARHNNKGGSRINITLRRPVWADILLAAIFA